MASARLLRNRDLIGHCVRGCRVAARSVLFICLRLSNHATVCFPLSGCSPFSGGLAETTQLSTRPEHRGPRQPDTSFVSPLYFTSPKKC
jgi:hypothetical protein